MLNIWCITTNIECTIIQLCTCNYIYLDQRVDIYTAQTNTFSQVKYYYNFFFFINVNLFHSKIYLKCSSANVLVFVFKFFSYNQTDNPRLSSTVKYITRINIMLQQKPIFPPHPPPAPHVSCFPEVFPYPGPTCFCPPCLPASACQLTDTQTDKQRSVEMQMVIESHTPKSHGHPMKRKKAEKRVTGRRDNIKQTANAWSHKFHFEHIN